MKLKWLTLVVLFLASPALSYWQSRLQVATGCVATNAPTGGIYDNATLSGWALSNATLSTNQLIAPDCTETASTVVEDITTNTHAAYVQVTHTFTAAAFTFSGYLQRGVGTRNAWPEVSNSTVSSTLYVYISLDSCTVISGPTTTGAAFTLTSATATLQSNGWCKFTLGGTITDTSVFLAANLLSGTSTKSYTGDGSSSVSYWGIDLR